MRAAVLFGINDYDHSSNLRCCINDAKRMAELLAWHAPSLEHTAPKRNFDCRVITSDLHRTRTEDLRSAVHKLFAGRAEVSLFYFAGHGSTKESGNYLAATDSRSPTFGLPLNELLEAANRAVREHRHREVVIILDCCYSGGMGNIQGFDEKLSFLQEGVSILTASEHDQESAESNGHGIFTAMICEALDGGAADVLGKTTVAAIYSYADQLLGPFQQRPQFKTNISEAISLRDLPTKVPLRMIRELPNWFKKADAVFPLDPSYEPDSGVPIDENVAVFRQLQKLNRIGVLKPHDVPHPHEDHMYYAAMLRCGCVLTQLGRFYWRMVHEGRL